MNSLDFKHHPKEDESSKSEEGGRELFEVDVKLAASSVEGCGRLAYVG
eukprot:COSAG01_NODE_4503_length_4970_cov_90.727161_4_plen_48_part_00